MYCVHLQYVNSCKPGVTTNAIMGCSLRESHPEITVLGMAAGWSMESPNWSVYNYGQV